MPSPLNLFSEDLAARCVDPGGDVPAERDLVLVWVRGAMRASSNPLIEAGAEAANALDLPLLVYQCLDDRHPYASDRIWRFVLEGAADLDRDLKNRGIRYAFHLATGRADGEPPLVRLARKSAVVIADVHPVEPIRSWTEALAVRVPETPVVLIDASCIVPVTATDAAPERAFEFRKKTRKHRKRWLGWQPQERPAPAEYSGGLPFEPVDFAAADLDVLIAGCTIDHGIGPIPETRGGAQGLARWQAFKETGLKGYARDRNDALRDGVSRMSAYFHFGMVSPFAIAAEAQQIGGPGAEKYLDELLVWREVAWHFCHHTRDVDSTAALPGWARKTLAEREQDPRATRSWDELARGQSGDALWDAMQTSLIRHGELHNNLRMTWGKAIPFWTATVDGALERLIDLNHRFALDGRDPASYGGLLWCLGQFDRPFPPSTPVLGDVRPRPTKTHASRLDVQRYADRVARPASGSVQRIAVIGAGIAGLSAARALQDAGHAVECFDKARGVGGRTSLRRAEPYAFDHGAQYFTARDPRFRRSVDAWLDEGIVVPFTGRIAAIDRLGEPAEKPATAVGRFVGSPGMNELAKRMARGIDVQVQSHAAEIERIDKRWTLRFEPGGPAPRPGYDAVLVTTPPPQAVPLVAASARLAEVAGSVAMDPCWAAMVAFETPLDCPFDGAFVNAGPLAWICRNSAKHGRPAGEAWVLHASPRWTREHIELEKTEAAALLTEALGAALGATLPPIVHLDAHRWMDSAAAPARNDGAIYDPDLGLGLAGDWLMGSKVQGAWLSGRALAGRVLADAARRVGDG